MLNDTVILKWHKKYEGYYLTRGNETYYDENRYLLVWDSVEEAIKWCADNLYCEVDSGALDPNMGTEIKIKQTIPIQMELL